MQRRGKPHNAVHLSDLQSFKKKTGAVKARLFDRRIAIPSGEAGTAATIAEMERLAVKGGRDVAVRLMALDIIEGIPARDHRKVAERIFQWLQDNGSGEKSGVKFVNDPFRVETVQDPWITLFVTGCGDCNSAHSTTSAALLLSVGIPCMFRTVKADPRRPDSYSHVYTVALVRGEPVAMDTSVPFSTFGSEPKTITGKRDWPIRVEKFVEDDWRRS